jgi:predicted ester cyclase
MTAPKDPAGLLRYVTEEVWNKGRLELVDELVAESFVDHVDVPGLEGGGPARYRRSVEMVRTAMPDYHEEIEWCVAEGDMVADYVRTIGTHEGDFFGLAPTGKRLEMRAFGALRVADGQIVERWGLGDTMALLGQLGLD